MADAATALLHDLDADQRNAVSLDFPCDDERRRWFYAPTDHGGLPLAEMSAVQQQSCIRLVATGLSEEGFVTAAAVMATENVLDHLEGWRRRGPVRIRDPFRYSVTVFGDPGAAGWGWRFGGHHLSLNVTIVNDEIRSTPCFFGADPAVSPLPGGSALRPFGGMEDHARSLATSLDLEQLEAALLAPVPPLDVVMGNRPRIVADAKPMDAWEIFRGAPPVPVEALKSIQSSVTDALGLRPEHVDAIRYTAEPRGLSASVMTREQRKALVALVRAHLYLLTREVAAEREAIVVEQLDHFHFVWAGRLEPGEPHYYRVQGPRMLIEYDNVQRNGNHVHSVLRDPMGDFGEDVLANHYTEHHA